MVSDQTKRMTYLTMNEKIQNGQIRTLREEIKALDIQRQREASYLYAKWAQAEKEKLGILKMYNEMRQISEESERKAAAIRNETTTLRQRSDEAVEEKTQGASNFGARPVVEVSLS